jgi:hypothetical protein
MSRGDEADRVIEAALIAATGGIDLEATTRAMGDFARALERQAGELARASYEQRKCQADCPKCGKSVTVVVPHADPESVAKAMALTARAADIVLRLMAFARGKPDSRPGGGAAPEWLADLEPEQVVALQGWIAAAKARRG